MRKFDVKRFPPEFNVCDPILKSRNLLPVSRRRAQEMRVLTTIAIQDGREQIAPVRIALQLDFGDARKLFADLVAIFLCRRPEFVKIHLLIKSLVRRRPFAWMRIARIEKAGAVRVPRYTAASRRKL